MPDLELSVVLLGAGMRLIRPGSYIRAMASREYSILAISLICESIQSQCRLHGVQHLRPPHLRRDELNPGLSMVYTRVRIEFAAF